MNPEADSPLLIEGRRRTLPRPRGGGRVAYCSGLENRQRRKAFEGSNPSPSAFHHPLSTTRPPGGSGGSGKGSLTCWGKGSGRREARSLKNPVRIVWFRQAGDALGTIQPSQRGLRRPPGFLRRLLPKQVSWENSKHLACQRAHRPEHLDLSDDLSTR